MIIDRLRSGALTRSAEATQQLAAEFAHALPPAATVALHGDLGVGKTTFVQGMAQAFGVAGRVTSPTFSLFTVHQGTDRRLVHLDAYRLENERQVDALLLEDFLGERYCLAVEWPENVGSWLPAGTWHLDLAIDRDHHHRIQLR